MWDREEVETYLMGLSLGNHCYCGLGLLGVPLGAWFSFPLGHRDVSPMAELPERGTIVPQKCCCMWGSVLAQLLLQSCACCGKDSQEESL